MRHAFPHKMLRPFEWLLCFRTDAVRAKAIPNDDKHYGDGKNQGGDGIYLRRNAAAEAAPDFKGERVVASDEEEGDGNFVHRECEDEEARGDQRELEIWQCDAPESLPGGGAEIERGFFLSAVVFLKTGEKFGGGYGDESGAVAEKNCQQAKVCVSENSEHLERQTGDD